LFGGAVLVGGEEFDTSSFIYSQFNENKARSGGALCVSSFGTAYLVESRVSHSFSLSFFTSFSLSSLDSSLQVYQNSAYQGGALAQLESSLLVVVSSHIFNNSATFGAGSYHSGTEIRAFVEESVFEFNQASQGGGIAMHNWVSLSISDSFLRYNTASRAGISFSLRFCLLHSHRFVASQVVLSMAWTVLSSSLPTRLLLPTKPLTLPMWNARPMEVVSSFLALFFILNRH
jgi:hypothetical protein